jgi:hypothetical protein
MMTHMRELHSWSFSGTKRAAAGGKEGKRDGYTQKRKSRQERGEKTKEEKEKRRKKTHHFQKRCVLEAQDGTNRLLPRTGIFRPFPALPPPPVSDPKSIQVLKEVLDEVLIEVLNAILREVLNEVSASGVNLCVMFRIYILLPNLRLECALRGAFRLVIQHQA